MSAPLLWSAVTGAAAVFAARSKRRKPATFTNQGVVITGGSRGLGLALAREFGSRGARLCLIADQADELHRAVDLLENDGILAMPITCDVAVKEQVREAFGEASDYLGSIDVLVNNAGVIEVGPARSLVLQDYYDAMNVNFWGVVHGTFAVLPPMLEQGGGSVVNIASIGGRISVPHLLPYSCSKAAVTAFSEGLHTELAADDIHVMTVTPGLMKTGSHVQADFRGNQQDEYAWFAASANAPLLAIPAKDAAEEIVEGLADGKRSLTLGTPAKLMRLAKSAAPGALAASLRAASRMLPDDPEASSKKVKGLRMRNTVGGALGKAIRFLGDEPIKKHQGTSVR